MSTNTREDKVKIIFANHPKQDVIYMTSKDIAYFNEDDAKAAAALAGNKQVEKFERTSVPADEELEKQKAAQDAEKKLAESKSAESLQTETKDGEAEASPAATQTEGEQLGEGVAPEAGDTVDESAPDSDAKQEDAAPVEPVKEAEPDPVKEVAKETATKAPVKKSNTKTKK